MHICYVDESGTSAALRRGDPNSTPVFVLVGITVPGRETNSLTWDYLQLKKRFNPSQERVQLSRLIQFEMKGSGLRKDLRRPSHNRASRARGILDEMFDILERRRCQLLGKILVKVPDQESAGDPQVYSAAIAQMAQSFQAQLAAADTSGMMVLDARTKVKNAPNALGITTRRFRSGGGEFPNLLESPVFGHSDTHVPLQLADILASAVLFPIACTEYCGDLHWNAHPHPNYRSIKTRYGQRLQQLEYRYVNAAGELRGGFQVIDAVSKRPTHLLFRD